MTIYDVVTRRPLEQLRPDGARALITRTIAREEPVALEYNGFGYAVLMASPCDLEDLAYGFSLTEKLIDGADDIEAIDRHAAEGGTVLRITLAKRLTSRLGDRVRPRLSDSSCGLCGIENLEQVTRPLPAVTSRCDADPKSIFRALRELSRHQPMNAETGAIHAAAQAGADGSIRLAREDVGRHNALDKLIGAMLRADTDWEGGFILLSSRCSYELVEKAILANCPMLVTVSAPTELALKKAQASGLKLVTLAREDAVLIAPDVEDR